MKKILISGNRGFVGTALEKYLEKETGFEFIKTGSRSGNDFTLPDVVSSLPKADIIVHLASKNFIPESFEKPDLYYRNNIVSTINLLEKARVDRAKIIFLSTYVYGKPAYLPIDESHGKQALNPYTQSKLVCEELCEAYHRDFGVNVIIFRPFNIYGPGQGEAFFIPSILRQINEPVIALNDSRPKRDFIFIDDVVDAIYQAITNETIKFSIYNLGTGISTSVKNVVGMIHQLSGSQAEIKFSDKVRQGEILDTVADIKKIGLELGWQPKVSLQDGIMQIIKSTST